MTKKDKPLLKVTATLLNSWAYLFNAPEAYSDKAYQDFLSYLNREKIEQTFYMLRGIKFEKKCIEGYVAGITPLIEGGVYQAYFEKDLEVDDYDVRILGYLDVLKEGIVYDIKRVSKYERPKYYNSYQHHVYMELVPEASEFNYLIAAGNKDENVDIYTETYRRDEAQDIREVIKQFYQWLQENDLFDLYLKNFNISDRR